MITLMDLYAAQDRLRPYLTETPLLLSRSLSNQFKKSIWLKLETQLPTGSFKPRPAFNHLLMHKEAAQQKGIVASSSGNFAQGVAYAARELSIDAIIVMPENTSPFKIQRTKDLGATVILCKNDPEDRVKTTLKIQKETGRLLLHPYDADETIAGDGVIGLEIADWLTKQPHVATDLSVLVPVSGGGLLAGIAFALKALHPHCRIIGIQSIVNGSLKKSLEAKKCVAVAPFHSIADALVATSPGEKPFEIIQKTVDHILLVTEQEIEHATRYLIDQHKLVVEAAGALPLAALISGQVTSQQVICIVSGGNIKLDLPFKHSHPSTLD